MAIMGAIVKFSHVDWNNVLVPKSSKGFKSLLRLPVETKSESGGSINEEINLWFGLSLVENAAYISTI